MLRPRSPDITTCVSTSLWDDIKIDTRAALQFRRLEFFK
jgi:hypothetical protein